MSARLSTATLTGETKTEAIGRALEERKARLGMRHAGTDRLASLEAFLQREIRSAIPSRLRGRKRNKREIERILGCGEEGA